MKGSKEPKLKPIKRNESNLSSKIFEEEMPLTLESSMEKFFKENRLRAEDIVSASYYSHPGKKVEFTGYYSCLLIYKNGN